MCTLLLSSTLHPDKESQMPFCFSLKVSWPAAQAPEHSLSAQSAACQQQNDICQKALFKLFPPGKSPTTPASSNSYQLEQKFNIPPTLLPSRSSHQVQQRHHDTWHRERLAASSLPSRTLLPATLQRITANCSKELPAQTPATEQISLSTAILSPGSKLTSPSWHHQLTKWNKDTQGRLCI